jgi:hypothetical protein
MKLMKGESLMMYTTPPPHGMSQKVLATSGETTSPGVEDFLVSNA